MIDLSTAGFTTLEFPGPAFRPIPSFTIDIPPGWLVTECPDALCLIGTDATSPEPWSNVFVQYIRAVRTIELEAVAKESFEALKASFPDAEIVSERMIGFDQASYMRELVLIGDTVSAVDKPGVRLSSNGRPTDAMGERTIGFDKVHYIREMKLTLMGEKVTRVDSYVFGPNIDNPTVDLFHFICMHPVEAGDERTNVYMKMLSSLSFD